MAKGNISEAKLPLVFNALLFEVDCFRSEK